MGAVLSQETAEEQVKYLLDYYDFDLDALPDNVKRVIGAALAQMKKCVINGRLEIEASGSTIAIKQHLKRAIPGVSNPIVYGEITGACKVAIGDGSGDYGKVYAFLGALSKEGLSAFLKLSGADLSLAEALGAFFLQV